MASKVKNTVSIDEALVRELEGASRQRGKSRSRLEQELKEGYQAMAREDRATAERNLKTGWEALE